MGEVDEQGVGSNTNLNLLERCEGDWGGIPTEGGTSFSQKKGIEESGFPCPSLWKLGEE